MAMAPTIGEMKRRVRIRVWSDAAAAGFGIDQSFDAGQTIWARLQPAGTALFYGTQQIEPGMTHRLACWRSSTVNALVITRDHVAEHGGIRYRVLRVTDLEGDRQFVVMDLEQLGVIPA